MEEMVACLIQWISDRFTGRRKTEPKVTFSALFRSFQKILQLNNKILELMAEMGDKLGGDYVFDRQYIDSSSRRMGTLVYELIYNFNALAPSSANPWIRSSAKSTTIFRRSLPAGSCFRRWNMSLLMI